MPSNQPRSLFINNLSENVDKEFLTEEFSRFGKIEEVKVFYHGRKHLKMGSVLYFDPTAARRAFRTMNNNTLFGVKITIQLDNNGDLARSNYEKAISLGSENPPPPPPPSRPPPLPPPIHLPSFKIQKPLPLPQPYSHFNNNSNTTNVVIKSDIEDVDMQIDEDDDNTTYTTLTQPQSSSTTTNSQNTLDSDSSENNSTIANTTSTISSPLNLQQQQYDNSNNSNNNNNMGDNEIQGGDNSYTPSPPAKLEKKESILISSPMAGAFTLKISHLPTSNSLYSTRLYSFFSHFKPKRVCS